MTKLTVRYFIDGQQADETEIDQPTADDARELIGCIKDAVGEIVSETTWTPTARGLRAAFERLPKPGDAAEAGELSMTDVVKQLGAEPGGQSGFNPSQCPYCTQLLPSGFDHGR